MKRRAVAGVFRVMDHGYLTMSIDAMDGLGDAELLARYAADGDELAFAAIARRHIDHVYAASLRVLGDAALAEDTVQETFYKLMQRPGQVKQSLAGWLHRTATHLAIDRIRRDARRRKRDRVHHEQAETLRPDTTWAELSPLIDEALESVDTKHRDLLVEHFLHGRTLTEIARERGVSKATLSRRCRDALEAVRGQLRRRGVMVTAGALTAGLAGGAQAAPSGLAAAVGKMSLASGMIRVGGWGASIPGVCISGNAWLAILFVAGMLVMMVILMLFPWLIGAEG